MFTTGVKRGGRERDRLNISLSLLNFARWKGGRGRRMVCGMRQRVEQSGWEGDEVDEEGRAIRINR